MKRLRIAKARNASLVVIGLLFTPHIDVAHAVFFGAETSGIVGRSSTSSGAISVNEVTFGPDGGDGVLSATTIDTSNRGDLEALADFSRISAGVPVPLLSVDAAGGNDGFFNGVAQAFSGAVASYQYIGPSGNVTFNWQFKGELQETDANGVYPSTTSTAFFNVRGGIMTGLSQFQPDIQQVNALNVADTFVEAYNTDQQFQSFDESGNLSIFLNSGDVFSVTLRLAAWAGNPGARTDALQPVPIDAGLTGDFILPNGGSLTVIPEPTSAMLLVIATAIAALRCTKR